MELLRIRVARRRTALVFTAWATRTSAAIATATTTVSATTTIAAAATSITSVTAARTGCFQFVVPFTGRGIAAGRVALWLSLTRSCSSTSRTLTASMSPTLTTELTSETYSLESSLMWHKPSRPGRISTNAPKSLTLVTRPS